MLLAGTGPGLYLDLPAFIFQVPYSDSWACARSVPAITIATATLIQIRTVLPLIWHLSRSKMTVWLLVCFRRSTARYGLIPGLRGTFWIRAGTNLSTHAQPCQSVQ